MRENPQLRYIVRVVEFGSMGRAAQDLRLQGIHCVGTTAFQPVARPAGRHGTGGQATTIWRGKGLITVSSSLRLVVGNARELYQPRAGLYL